MNKKIFSACCIALSGIMASCSSGDETDIPMVDKADNAIAFNAMVPKAPRAASTTTATIKEFYVYAFTAGKPYMERVAVRRNGSSWTYTPVMYWPDTPVNFYAYSPNISNSPVIGDDAIGDIPAYTCDGQTDLLYAVNIGETAQASPVNMNFRHALSRVSVMLSSSNANIRVHVRYVVLHDLYHTATFYFPDATTSASSPGIIGNWQDFSLNADVALFYAMGDEDNIDLTTTPVDITENNLNVSFFIPQKLNKMSLEGSNYTGNYIEVDCEIFDSTSGVKIWPTSSTPPSQLVPETPAGRLVFPLTTSTIDQWKIGHAYIYNIKIDNPTVLQPIDFNVTVDDYEIGE
ncbi:fimbrillin family protein [uncultured Muribaculum sp.]|uniref:fimbrillin family protein n=1 Tax=uncultured Muribaculum sp. TaxID=1918613 RepID=UPI0025D5E8D1|nr:fimbrillin family protein [uncultured Muribaculum sp.]